MSSRRNVLLATTLLLLCTACGGFDEVTTEASPMSSPLPVTATPVPPTATPIPPTATPTPPEPSPTQTDDPRAAIREQLGYVPFFEPGECRFPRTYQYDVVCGYLVVPEDRSQPDSPEVRLHVAIYRSRNAEPEPDPVIYLAGGAGTNQLDAATFYLSAVGRDILRTRDFIMYNQRGAVYDWPSLQCPGFTAFAWDLASEGLTKDEKEVREIEFLLACQEQLLERGINLEAYNSAANAADVSDLRLVLGYDQVNLYATSYGTRLALTVLRDYPQGIRSVILDSVYPPQVGYYTELAPNINRAFGEVFAACASDPECDSRYPDVAQRFYETVRALYDNPLQLTLGGRDVYVDGGMFSDAIVFHLYSPHTIGRIPMLVYQASQGDYEELMPMLAAVLDFDGISWGVNYSMDCREEIPYESYEEALAEAAEAPITDSIRPSFIFPLCQGWKSGIADPIENEPVSSDIPALVFAAQFDPATPPAWGRLAAETLSNSFFFEFPGQGHGVMRSNRCGLEIGLQFLEDPTSEPDSSCLQALPAPDFE